MNIKPGKDKPLKGPENLLASIDFPKQQQELENATRKISTELITHGDFDGLEEGTELNELLAHVDFSKVSPNQLDAFKKETLVVHLELDPNNPFKKAADDLGLPDVELHVGKTFLDLPYSFYKIRYTQFLNEGRNPLLVTFLGFIVKCLYGEAKPFTQEEYTSLTIKTFGLLRECRNDILARLDNPKIDEFQISEYIRKNVGLVMDIKFGVPGYSRNDLASKITEQLDAAQTLIEQAKSLKSKEEMAEFLKNAFPLEHIYYKRIDALEKYRKEDSTFTENVKGKLAPKEAELAAALLDKTRSNKEVATTILTETGYKNVEVGTMDEETLINHALFAAEGAGMGTLVDALKARKAALNCAKNSEGIEKLLENKRLITSELQSFVYWKPKDSLIAEDNAKEKKALDDKVTKLIKNQTGYDIGMMNRAVLLDFIENGLPLYSYIKNPLNDPKIKKLLEDREFGLRCLIEIDNLKKAEYLKIIEDLSEEEKNMEGVSNEQVINILLKKLGLEERDEIIHKLPNQAAEEGLKILEHILGDKQKDLLDKARQCKAEANIKAFITLKGLKDGILKDLADLTIEDHTIIIFILGKTGLDVRGVSRTELSAVLGDLDKAIIGEAELKADDATMKLLKTPYPAWDCLAELVNSAV